MKAANQVVSFGKQLFSIRYVYSGSDFKPCSHEGSDPQKWYKNNSQRVSIHVPIMGATTEIAQICPLVRVSIHAPTKGALMSPTLRISCSFNPSSHEGSDTVLLLFTLKSICFNPRSHEGSDSNFDQKFIPLFDKNHKLSFSKLNFPFPIHSFFQNTLHLCTFQGANSSTISCPLPIRTLTLSQN